jgi:RNA polymerase sigma-70 factor, ECF subfamily
VAWISAPKYGPAPSVPSKLCSVVSVVVHARARQAGKRGGKVETLPLDQVVEFSPARSRELIELDDALESLERLDPQQARVVELRFFGGLTVEETAEVLGISPRTVKRDWRVARAWLHGELSGRAEKQRAGVSCQ